MFAPTRAYAGSFAYVYLVTHKRAVPRRGGPFRRRRPSAPERSSGDILFPGIFTSRYITHRPGPDGVGALCTSGPGPKRAGPRDTTSFSLFLALFRLLPPSPSFYLSFPRGCRRVCALAVRVTSRSRVQYVEFPPSLSLSLRHERI